MNFLKTSLPKSIAIFLPVLFPIMSFAQDVNEKHKGELVNTSEAFAARQSDEEKAGRLAYSFIAHKPTFILPLTYSFHPNPNGNGSLEEVDKTEIKFQFSFKINLIEEFFDHFRLSFGYTNLSFWQFYNKQDSAAFREANHEPELFFVYNPYSWGSGKSDTIYRIGYVHQSNGQDVERSRSWNRVYGQVIHDFGHLLADLKVWHRIQEDPKEDPADSEGDDNPDITDFMGNFELRLTTKFDKNTLSVMWRNNLDSPNKGAVDVTFSVPFKEDLKFYVQYFNGYGESLIDYNYSIERIGIGVVMSDWL